MAGHSPHITMDSQPVLYRQRPALNAARLERIDAEVVHRNLSGLCLILGFAE